MVMSATRIRLTDGIEPEPARCRDDQPRDHHASRGRGVAEHVNERAADVEIILAAGHEPQRGADVDGDADQRDGHDDPGADGRRIAQAVDCLERDRADGDEQNRRVGQRGEDREAPQSVRTPRGRAGLGQQRARPGQHEPEHVAEIVSGIGCERQRVRANSKHDLGDDEREVEADADREGVVVARRAMVMAVVGVRMPMCDVRRANDRRANVRRGYGRERSSSSVQFDGVRK